MEVILGVDDADGVASSFMSDAVFFIMGSLMLAVALVNQGLDKRLALSVINVTGNKTWRIVLGFVTISAFLSSFIGEHTVAAMMLPVALALIRNAGLSTNKATKLSTLLLFSIAYGCAIGSIGTPSGGGRNVIMIGYISEFGMGTISYLDWMKFAYPMLLIEIPIVTSILWYTFTPEQKIMDSSVRKLKVKVAKTGRLTANQILAIGIFLLVFLALSSGMTFFLGRFFERDQADLTAFFSWHPWLFLVLMPAIGMRLWAEERRSGTIELLITLPVTNTQLVVGKFLASWIFTLIALILTMPIWITVNYLGEPDNNVILISYFGSWLMAGAFLALTSCLSALTKNQVIAFIISSISGFVLIMAGFNLVLSAVRSWSPNWITETISSMSILSHFSRIQMGVFDLSTLVFFISMIILCLWINVQLVQVKKAD